MRNLLERFLGKKRAKGRKVQEKRDTEMDDYISERNQKRVLRKFAEQSRNVNPTNFRRRYQETLSAVKRAGDLLGSSENELGQIKLDVEKANRVPNREFPKHKNIRIR
jgi:hypothetical protein